MVRTLALIVLLSGCGGSDPAASSPVPNAEDEPTAAAESPSADATGALEWRAIAPYQLRSDAAEPTALRFADQTELEAGTLTTPVMGQTYTPPDFAAEHVVGVVLPVAPGGTELTVQRVALDGDGVITVTCTVTRPSEPASFTVQPSVVLGIPRAPGARSIVVLIDEQRIAELPLR